MHSPDDEKLRNAFDELRRSEESLTPPFARLWNAGRRGPKLRALAFAASALLIAFSLTIYMLRQRSRPEPAIASLQTTSWTAPTDFLLNTPGSALRSTVPTFARVPDYAPMTTRKEKQP